MPAITANNYYTFNITANPAANNSMSVLETAYNPELISTVTQSPAANAVVNTSGVTVSITTSVAPNANIFVRYTTNGWSTSTLVQASFAGVNGTAVIPAFPAGTNVSYYVYSSSRTLAAINNDVTTYGQVAHDMATLRLNNNAGSNYNYTVLAGVVTVNASNVANDASYARLGDAFTAINNGVHTGVVNITITGNTTELSSAVLNASGTGSASYTALSIQPSGGAVRTVSGNLAAPLVDLNGADNVTIDGLNSGGNGLTFSNASTANTAGTSTIRMYNGVTGTTLQRCTVEGSTTSGTDGVLSFGSGTNNGITIDGNTIKAAGSNLPFNTILSSGINTATLNNNNIQDYFNPGGNSAGLNINGFGTGWAVTGNRFFQTGVRTFTAAGLHRAISATTGGGYNISNNIIGFASASQTGTTTYTGAYAGRFIGIDLALNTTVSSVQNNLVGGISLSTTSGSSTGSGVFTGIFVNNGSVNIGTVTGNRIGVISTAPISITSSTDGGTYYGIYVFTGNTVSIQNNSISAFTVTGSTAGVGCRWAGIYTTGSGNITINANTIGHASTANAVTVGTNGFTTGNSALSGINILSTGTTTLGTPGNGNIIANMSLQQAAVSGIAQVNGINFSAVGPVNMAGNSIYALAASSNTALIRGIYAEYGTTVTISRNKVYDLSGSGNAASVNGIMNAFNSTVSVTLSNNLVGDLRAPNNINTIPPASVQGINLNGTGGTVNVYNNTVYLTGTATGTTAFGSAALYANTANTLNLRNNILSNNSTPKGTGFAVAYQRSSNTLTSYASTSNNNLFYAGAPSTANLIYYDGTNSDQTLAAYQARVSTRDNLSVTGDLSSVFLSTTGSSSNFLHLNPAIANLAEGGGGTIAGVTDDVDGDLRCPTGGCPGAAATPDIGADEFAGIACGTLPTLTSIATAGPYYAGDVITINGTNLTGTTGATINGVAATIGTVTATTIQLTVPGTITTVSGNIVVTKAPSCGYSNALAFTFSGFITKGGGAGSGNWSTATIWRGNAVPPANAMVIINNGDAVTLDVSADPNSLTINATASLTHQNNSFTLGNTNLTATNISGTLTIDNAATPVLNSTNRFRSATVTVLNGGVFTNNSAIATAVNITNFNVNNGGVYNHNAIGSVANGASADFPGSSARNFGATSNVVITKWANGGTAPVNLPASGTPGWGNLTISVSTLGGSWNQLSQLTNVQGTLTIAATGGGANEFRLAGSTSLNCTINRLSITGGILGLNSNSLTVNLTITTDFTITGTGSFFGPSNTTPFTLLVSGNASVNTTGEWRFASSTSASLNMTITGNLTIDAGTVTYNSNVTSYTLTVGGNTTLNGGLLFFAGGTGTTGVNFSTANFIQNGGTTSFQNASGGNMNVTGRIEIAGGVFQILGSSAVVVWTVGTNMLVSGASTSITNQGTTTFTITGSLNISGGTFSPSNGSSSNMVINLGGDFNITGTGSFASSNSGNVIINLTGSFTQSSSSAAAFRFQNGATLSKTYRMVVGGNFSVTGGNFIGGSTSSPDSIIFNGGLATANFNLSGSGFLWVGGSPNALNRFAVYKGKTLLLNNSITPVLTSSTPWSFTVYSGGTLDVGTSELGGGNQYFSFNLNSGATVRTANVNGLFGTTAGSASITMPVANASFNAGATYVFNGSSAQVTSVFATTPAATPANLANLVINNAAGVTLSAAYNVTTALQLQTGNLTLNTFDLTTASITGAPYSAVKMVVTNSTGELGLPVPTAGLPVALLYPIGNSGSYTPAQFNFSANSTSRFLLLRAVTPRNPNDLSTPDYINNRWWNTDLSVTTGTYTYTSTFTYIAGDLVGTAANIRLNRWTGSAWVNDASSFVNTGTNTLNSSTLDESSGPLAATAQWVGRSFRAPAIYRWANAVSGSWLVPANWNPVGVPGSGDGVIFDPAGPAYTVTNMPTGISLVVLEVTNNNNVTLQTGSAGTVSMIPLPNFSSISPQFQVDAGSSLTVSGSNALNLNLPAGTTGAVGGSCNLQQASHTITVNDPLALLFSSGSYFSTGIIPATGYSGNPFGATGTNNAVIFQSGAVCETFEGANPFGNAGVNIVTFQAGSLFKYSDPNPATLPSISGRTYANFEYSANKVSNFAAAANAFVCDQLTVSAGTANFSLQGTPGHAIRGNITVASGTTLTFTPAVAGTVNLNSGGTQVISGAGTLDINALTTFNIASGTTVSLQKNMGVNSTAILNINGTLICTGENYISSPVANGTVNLNANGTLQVESVNGINNSLTTGNIRSTYFNGTTGHFIFAGNANQLTGNRLTTINSPGTLTIANTGTAPNNVVTLTQNITTPRLNLNAGRFNAGPGAGRELVISAGGIVSGGGGNQELAGAANENVIRFAGNGAVQGTPELYNVTIGNSGGGVDFTNNARINSIFLINNLGAVNPNAPRYATGSTLIYNPGGAYTRNVEWGSNTPGAPSYPHHVIIRNGTTLSFTGSTPASIGCGGDLSIGAVTGAGNGTLDLSAVGNIPLNIGGNLNIGGASATGSLILSNTIGGDINLGGNWTRNANGSVNFGAGNGRAIYFVGSSNATITAAGGQQFPYVFINKNAKTTRVTLADHVSISDMISFTQGTVDLGTNNKFLTLLSTAAKTARVGQSSAANTDFVYGSSDNLGQFIIQRYMPARRAWRLMAAPLKPGGGTHTIAQAWQERSTGLSYTSANWSASVGADTIAAGFGTQITGGTMANGFDESNNNSPSIRYYSAGSWLSPANTNNTSVNSQEGWMLFVRGDRKDYGEITNQYKTPTITTLRPRGQLFIGTKSITASGVTVVGNPYASAVDYQSMSRTGSGWPANPTYYVWDPYLGGAQGVGAFVALTWNGTNFTRSAPLTGTGTSSIDNRVIPSGAAILVDFPAGGGTLTMGESDKKDSSTTVAFRPARREMMTVLHTRTADGGSFVSDGTLSLFDDGYNNDADINDVRKLSNFSTELVALSRNGGVFAIERKALQPDADTVFYFVNRLQRKDYQLQITMNEPDLPAHSTAFVEDLFLQKKTPVNLYDTVRYNFSVTADAASAANQRFRLVFRRSTWFDAFSADVLNRDILLQWTVRDEFNIGSYVIERSTDGIRFTAAGRMAAGDDSETAVSHQWLDAAPEPGVYYYRIRSISKTGAESLSEVLKVKIVKSSAQLYVFPNPVTQGPIQLQLSSAAAGGYEWKLMGGNGQLLQQQRFSHAGGTATQLIQPATRLAAGVYYLQVTRPGGAVERIPVLVNGQ